MREILFRAKRIDNDEWIIGSLITDVFLRSGQDIPYILDTGKAEYDCFEDLDEGNGIFEVDPETVCQHTGMTDKNGKRIWENDIVAYTDMTFTENGYSEQDCVGKVGWSKEELCFSVTNRLSAESWEVLGECVVIGNIFDNPELPK